MCKILATMASAVVILLVGQTLAKAGDCACCGQVAVTSAAPHATPESGTARAPVGAQRYSVAPAPMATLVIPYGRAYSYVPSSFPPDFTAYEDSAAAAYSPAAAIRPGQTLFTFGLRPAAAKALGNY